MPQTEIEPASLVEMVETVDGAVERSRDLRPDAAGAVLSLAQRQAIADAYDVMVESKYIAWRSLIDSLGLEPEQLQALLDRFVLTGFRNNVQRMTQNAIIFKEWAESGLSLGDFASQQALPNKTLLGIVTKYGRGILALEIAHDRYRVTDDGVYASVSDTRDR